MRKNAVVDLLRCSPVLCREIAGGCPAAAACTHHLLEQDGPGEQPMLLSTTACIGCGKCAAVCPMRAIEIARGI